MGYAKLKEEWKSDYKDTELGANAGEAANIVSKADGSISGIAGPGGGTEEKPVGTVCFAWKALNGWNKVETHVFAGDRSQVRQQATHHALQVIYDYLSMEDK